MNDTLEEEIKKVIHTKKFHSKELIPWQVAQNGKAAVIDWITSEQEMHRFKEGDEVAHKEWLEQKMYVEDILKEFREVASGLSSGKKKKVTRMLGVVVHYFDYNAQG